MQMEHKQAMYEQRLDESEVEINSLRCQLTELMGVYDDLQVIKKSGIPISSN